MKSRMKRIVPAVVLYFGALAVFWALGYTGADVMVRCYLPLFVVILAAMLFKQYFSAYGAVLGVVLGLTAEYIHHLSRAGRPNMGGMFMNAAILTICTGAGVLIQSLVNGRRKRKEQEKES